MEPATAQVVKSAWDQCQKVVLSDLLNVFVECYLEA